MSAAIPCADAGCCADITNSNPGIENGMRGNRDDRYHSLVTKKVRHILGLPALIGLSKVFTPRVLSFLRNTLSKAVT